MKKQLSILFLITLLVSKSFSQKNLAEVNKIQGFYVFVDNTPIAEYDVVGEVSRDGASNDPDIKHSGAQYQAVRDHLLKKARLANYQADGIIIHLVTGGTDKAEILKFKDNQKDKNQAKVQQVQGLYIFTDCTPVSDYEYKGTVKSVVGLLSSQYKVFEIV